MISGNNFGVVYKAKMISSICVKSRYFFKNLKNVKLLPGNKTYCSTVSYVQGQSPERNVREYFYYIDHQGMVGTPIYIIIRFLLKIKWNILVITANK